ncbi:pleckstrin homology (PH) and lipid-binding START domains-containing protein [Actinidia rufa]|uniref:Pleckstrin homology (PH) and lipid-binding START domains-containing protein n=1 Tax=Actinidia rufa TaxID=165716 RepID=A0A7J0G8D3_9ERIC|nr:pleckstrin homology (PH) and lipid-binding START domains-containing protein [Actinidia rufa]
MANPESNHTHRCRSLKKERDRAESYGNASFTTGNYTDAIHHFTEAISLAPDNHVLYSNRSSAHASARKFTEAFSDAEKAVEIKPDWSKGYYRVGSAHMGIRRYDDAISAYKNGLEIDPTTRPSSPASPPPSPPLPGLASPRPSETSLLGRRCGPGSSPIRPRGPSFNRTISRIRCWTFRENPSTLNRHLKDPRIMQVLGVLFNVKLWRPNSAEDADIPDAEMTEEEPEPEDMDVPEEEREARERKKEAHKEKKKGNAAYKKKDFEAAIQHYAKAIELDDKDISFLTNRVVVPEEFRRVRARTKRDCTEKDHEVERERSRVLREVEERGSERAREKARIILLLLRGRDEAAAAEEEEAFEGGPSRARHRVGRNSYGPNSTDGPIYMDLEFRLVRARTKRDCTEKDHEICSLFEEDGNVVEVALIKDKRTGQQQGLKHESRNQELLDGARRCVEQINKASCGDLRPKELKEREVLIDFDENPKAALEHAKRTLFVMNKKCQGCGCSKKQKIGILVGRNYGSWCGVVDGTSEAVFRTVMSLGASRSEWRICHKSYKPGKESVVKHMHASDWTFWRSYLRKASARSVTVHMLERVAGSCLEQKQETTPLQNFSSVEMTKDIGLSQSEKEDVKTEVVQNSDELIKIEEDKMEAETDNVLSGNSSLRGLNDASDEFFDVPEHSDDDQLENDWPSNLSPELHYPDTYQPQMSTASGFVRKLHDLAVQKKVGYVDLQEVAWEENVSCCYGATLAKDPGCNLPCSWTTADPSTFLIRGESYLQALQKTKAKSTLLQMVAADWIRSDKRKDDLGSHPGGIVQKKYAANGGLEFFLIVNMQIPGSTTYGLALYFMTKTRLEETPILERFVNGDDAYRNSRFKLIPYISKVMPESLAQLLLLLLFMGPKHPTKA